ncbi:hypothetical protein EVAR_100027_1, partial [Eumeta japonica]
MLSPLRASNRDRPPLRHAPEFELIQDCDCEQRRAPTRSLNRVLLMPVYWGAARRGLITPCRLLWDCYKQTAYSTVRLRRVEHDAPSR